MLQSHELASHQQVHATLPILRPQVRPTLLNSQEWLRFWVEEHVVLPSSAQGGKRGRKTISFNSRSNSMQGSSAGNDDTVAGAVGVQEGGAGRQVLAAMAGSGAAGSSSKADIKAVRYALGYLAPT